MIDIQIEQRPEGWVYDWADTPKGADRREGWTNEKYPAVTLDECLDRLYDSIREKLPVGKLQGDETLLSGVVEQTETRSVAENEEGQ